MDRKYILLAIVLAFLGAIGYRISQTDTAEGARVARLHRIQKMMDEGRPVYTVTKEKKIHLEQRAQRLAGLIESLTETVTKKLDAKAAAKKVADKKDAKKKDAKKKALAKKKKKKKKESEPETDVAVTDEEKKSEDNNVAGGNSNIGGYAGQNNQNEDPNRIRQTVEEWMEYLSGADYERASEFIQAYQTSSIQSEVFYSVVTLLLKDDREVMHEHAVRALSGTTSTKSFVMLFGVESNEKETPKVRRQAESSLSIYGNLETVRYLNGVLTTKQTEAASLRALELLNVALEKAKKSNQPGESSGGEEPAPRTPASNPARYFTPFQTTLTRLAQGGGELASHAEDALKMIEALTSSAT